MSHSHDSQLAGETPRGWEREKYAELCDKKFLPMLQESTLHIF